MSTRPLWAEISRQRLLENYAWLRQSASPSIELLPVVKANAYGHAVTACAPLLVEAGARWLGVTGAEEGICARRLCPGARILLMSGIWAGQAAGVIEHGLTPVVWEAYHLDQLEQAAAARGLPPMSLAVHLELDTGMSRQGVRVTAADAAGNGELDALLLRFHAQSPLRLEGLMTHLSTPEVFSSTASNPQLDRFSAALDRVLARGLTPQWLHAGNTTTTVAGPDRRKLVELASHAEARLMLRPGLGLYGYLDRLTCDGSRLLPGSSSFEGLGDPAVRPVLAWKTRVTSLRKIRRGETAGYGDTFVAQRETRLALLPVGYADGLSRSLSNRGHVLLRAEQAPIAGRISMDQTIVDVTDIPGVSIGDEAVLIGSQGQRSITARDIADLTGTVVWEVLCGIGARVPRVVVE